MTEIKVSEISEGGCDVQIDSEEGKVTFYVFDKLFEDKDKKIIWSFTTSLLKNLENDNEWKSLGEDIEQKVRQDFVFLEDFPY